MFINDNNIYLNNQLYWLNIQLSNTKINIFEDINKYYIKYKIKRDQIYLPLLNDKYKIKNIYVTKIYDKNGILPDADYNYLLNWTDKFCRPFGGSHL